MGVGIEFIRVSVLAVHLSSLIEKLFSSGTAERGV